MFAVLLFITVHFIAFRLGRAIMYQHTKIMHKSGQIGEILTIFRFLFIPAFLATHLQVRPLTTFSRLMAQMTRTHACAVSYTHLTLPTILRV